MAGMNIGDRASAGIRLGLGALGITVLGLGVWGFESHAVGEHVADCGFDADGAYAKIRVNNWLGGAGEQDVHITFHVNGDIMQLDYGDTTRTVQVPPHGSVTTVVHGRFPPLRMFSGMNAVDSETRGRTVYRWEGQNVSFNPPQGWKFVSKGVAEQHPEMTSAETVPDDPSMLQCSTSVGGD